MTSSSTTTSTEVRTASQSQGSQGSQGIALSRLLGALDRPAEHLEASPDRDPTITGLAIDSRRVEPGDLFVAVGGTLTDGRRFVASAVESGAAAVLAAGEPLTAGEMGGRKALAQALSVPWWVTEEPRAAAGLLAARVSGHPDREMVTAAVTGTNGKSTVTAILEALFEAADLPTATFGTLGYGFRGELIEASRTTPEAPELFRLLRRFRDRGAEAVAFEASSHALALHRLAGVGLDAAIFTNLTRDHLDFHGDFESYYAAKRSLFDHLKPEGKAVLHLDDRWGRRMAEEIPGAFTYGTTMADPASAEAAVYPREVELSAEGIRTVLETPAGPLELESPLLGRYNLANLIAAVAAALALELPREAIVRGIAARGPLAGRLEPVASGAPFPVFIDYAHTPDALESALRSVAEFTHRRIIVVCGAGGDRDPGKREPMGRLAGELSALPILTSDNPRGEDPLAILRAVEAGVKESGNTAYRVVPDRREAIRRAVAVAGPEDAVLVTGKGHETYQEIGGRKRPFSDREELERALEERFGDATGH